MTTAADLAHDVMRWRSFKTAARPLLAQMALGERGTRERRALLARARRLARREAERRRLARHRRLCANADARQILARMAGRLESAA